MENLGTNLKTMVEKYHAYRIRNILISDLFNTTRKGLLIHEMTHEMIEHLGNKLGICYVDSTNIRRKHFVERWFTSCQIW